MIFKVFVARNSLASGSVSRSRKMILNRDHSGVGIRSSPLVTARSLIGFMLSSRGFSSARAAGTTSSWSRIVPELSSRYTRVIVLIVVLLQVGNSKKLLCRSDGVKNCFTLSTELVTNRIARELFMSSGGVILKNLKEIVNLLLKSYVWFSIKHNVIIITKKLFKIHILKNNSCNLSCICTNCYINEPRLKRTPARIVTVSCIDTGILVNDLLKDLIKLCKCHYYIPPARELLCIYDGVIYLRANCYVKSDGVTHEHDVHELLCNE